jgi:hypothetical protein
MVSGCAEHFVVQQPPDPAPLPGGQDCQLGELELLQQPTASDPETDRVDQRCVKRRVQQRVGGHPEGETNQPLVVDCPSQDAAEACRG